MFAQEPTVKDSKETGIGQEVQSGNFFIAKMALKPKQDSVTTVKGETRNLLCHAKVLEFSRLVSKLKSPRITLHLICQLLYSLIAVDLHVTTY